MHLVNIFEVKTPNYTKKSRFTPAFNLCSIV